jgi:pyrroloquinoline quinone (PQQ) biosynthesis protein C
MTRSVQNRYQNWIKKLLLDSRSYWERITCATLFTEIAIGKLSVAQLQYSVTNFYPVIEGFPKYLGIMLAKVPSGNRKEAVLARKWLIENLRSEAKHASWFVDLAAGFGVSRHRFLRPISPPPEMDAINNYLLRVCTEGSFAECLAAVNFAMEGPTGEWTKNIRKGLRLYKQKEGIQFGPDTMAWIDAHALYDDRHVEDALRLMGLFATTQDEQERASAAAIRALAYYAMAVESCYFMSKNTSLATSPSLTPLRQIKEAGGRG